MFIDDFVPIQCGVLMANAWLIAHGGELTERAAIAVLAQSVVAIGTPRTRADSLVVPIDWSTKTRLPFSTITGELETGPLGSDTTHLRLCATCDLTVAAPGRRTQNRTAARTTEQVVRTFLAGIAADVEHRAGRGVTP